MRRSLTIITLISMVVLAIQVSISSADPPSGRRLLNRIQDAYNDLESFSCSFRHEFQMSLIGEAEVVEGTMELAEDDCFRYETPHQVMITNGETLWRYSPLTMQVIIENLEDAGPGVLPREILFDYPSMFDITQVRDAMIQQRPAYLINLSPKEDGTGVREVKVWIDAEDSIARRMEWTDETGNRTTYILEEINVNPGIDDERFTFQVPEGVTVYDLR